MDRKSALAVVEAVRLGLRVKPVQEAIRRVLKRRGLFDGRRDRVVSGFTYSIYRYQGLLEYIINKRLGIDPRSLDPLVYSALLAVTYVNLLDEKSGSGTRRAFHRVAAGIIYRVIRDPGLRNKLLGYIREIRGSTWKPSSEIEELMFKYRVSPELYNALREAFDRLGEDLEAFLEYTLTPPPRVFRVNTLKATVAAIANYLHSLGVEFEEGRYSPRAVRIRGALPKEVIRLIETGILIPQDESSMVAVEILDPKPGSRIADLCAAPGGKTTYLAEYTRLKSRIYSFEIYRDRARRLRLLVDRVGASRVVEVYVEDARRAPEVLGEESMDYVLLDPPCSSTGALMRNPDVRWRFNPKDISVLVRQQYELLEAGWRILRRGGRLLYTVCSLLPVEGEDVVNGFLGEHKDAELVQLDKPFKPSPILPGTMRAYPHIHGVTGFYYALLFKK